MPQCPQCNKQLRELTRQCPSCRADLDLLVDYVSGLQGSLSRAEQLTRAGELAQAVWAYLEVLEVDPDNPTARRQVGQLATIVRQFDATATGRRWVRGLPAGVGDRRPGLARWVKAMLASLVVLVAFALGFLSGHGLPDDESLPAAATKKEPPKPPIQQLGAPLRGP